jgi:hypothetical protein
MDNGQSTRTCMTTSRDVQKRRPSRTLGIAVCGSFLMSLVIMRLQEAQFGDQGSFIFHSTSLDV